MQASAGAASSQGRLHVHIYLNRSRKTLTHRMWVMGFLLSVCLLMVDRNITGTSPMISSATDVTCSVVKKGSSEAKVVVTASDKVVFILQMNARLPDETSFEAEQTCCVTEQTSSRTTRRSPLIHQ